MGLLLLFDEWVYDELCLSSDILAARDVRDVRLDDKIAGVYVL